MEGDYIKHCIVKIENEQEFRDVETICFKNNVGWHHSGKEHILYINKCYITIRDTLTYSIFNNSDNKSISYKEFMEENKMSNLRELKETITVEIKTKKEFNNVAKLCLKNGYKWGDDDDTFESIKPDIIYPRLKICIRSNVNSLLYIKFDVCRHLISYLEFMNKYGEREEKITNEIKRCVVETNSKKEVMEVEDICFKQNIKWVGEKVGIRFYPRDEDNKLYLFIENKEIAFFNETGWLNSNIGKDYDLLISFKEFINQYGDNQNIITKIKNKLPKLTKEQEPFKLSDSLYKSTRPNLRQDN